MLIRYPEGGGRRGKAFHRKQSNGWDRHSYNNVSGAGRRSRRVWRQLVRPTGIWPFDLHRALHLRAGGMFRAFPAAGGASGVLCCLVGREKSGNGLSTWGRGSHRASRRVESSVGAKWPAGHRGLGDSATCTHTRDGTLGKDETGSSKRSGTGFTRHSGMRTCRSRGVVL